MNDNYDDCTLYSHRLAKVTYQNRPSKKNIVYSDIIEKIASINCNFFPHNFSGTTSVQMGQEYHIHAHQTLATIQKQHYVQVPCFVVTILICKMDSAWIIKI